MFDKDMRDRIKLVLVFVISIVLALSFAVYVAGEENTRTRDHEQAINPTQT